MSHPLYNPYSSGTQSSAQGQYGLSGTQAGMDPRTVSSRLGPGCSSGFSGASSGTSTNAGGMLSSMPPQLMSYEPGQNRSTLSTDIESSIDMHISRARAEVRRLSETIQQRQQQAPGQVTRLTNTPRDEMLSSSAGMNTFPVSSSSTSQGHLVGRPDKQSGSSSVEWKPSYQRPSADVSSNFYSSSSSSSLSSAQTMPPSYSSQPSQLYQTSSYASGTDGSSNTSSARGGNILSILGLGDYPISSKPSSSTAADSSRPKYTSQSATNILLHFGLSEEDLEHLIAYPEEQLTPANLPYILRDIRIQKTKRTMTATETDTGSDRLGSSGGPVMRHGEMTPTIRQPSKVIDYGHTSKYSGGFGDEIGGGRSSSIGARSGGSGSMLMMDTYSSSSHSFEPVQKNPELVKSASLASSRDQTSSITTLSSSHGSSLSSVTPPSQHPTDSQRPSQFSRQEQAPQMIQSLLSLPMKGTNSRTLESEAPKPIPAKEPGSRTMPKVLPHHIQVRSINPNRPSLVVLGSNPDDETKSQSQTQVQGSTAGLETQKKQQQQQPQKQQSQMQQTKQQSQMQLQMQQSQMQSQMQQSQMQSQMQQTKQQSQMQSQVQQMKQQSQVQQTKQQSQMQQTKQQSQMQQTKQMKPTWTQRNEWPFTMKAVPPPPLLAAGCSFVRPPPLIPGIRAVVNPPPVPAQVYPNPMTLPHSIMLPPAKVPVAKRLPTPTMMTDYASATPRIFPHTCSLCNKECAQMKDWITHQNTSVHLDSCKLLRKRFPDWDGEIGHVSSPAGTDVKSSTSSSSQSSQQRRQKTRYGSRSRSRSRSRSPSPRHDRPSSSSHRHRSRSRSASPRRPRRTEREQHRGRSRSPPSSRHTRRSRTRSRSMSRSRSRSTRRDPPSSSYHRRSRSSSRERRSSSGKQSSRRQKESSAERLAKKLLDTSGVQSLSDRSGLEAMVQSLAPALLAELAKRKSSSSSTSKGGKRSSSPSKGGKRSSSPSKGAKHSSIPSKGAKSSSAPSKGAKSSSPSKGAKPSSSRERICSSTPKGGKRSSSAASSSSSSARKDSSKLLPEASSSSGKSNTTSKSSKPSTPGAGLLRLMTVPASASYKDVVSALERFGKTTMVLLLRSIQQASVCYEKEEDAKALTRSKDFTINGSRVTVITEKENFSQEQKKISQKKPLASISSTTSTKPTLPHEPKKPIKKTGLPVAKGVTNQKTPAKSTKAKVLVSKAKGVVTKWTTKTQVGKMAAKRVVTNAKPKGSATKTKTLESKAPETKPKTVKNPNPEKSETEGKDSLAGLHGCQDTAEAVEAPNVTVAEIKQEAELDKAVVEVTEVKAEEQMETEPEKTGAEAAELKEMESGPDTREPMEIKQEGTESPTKAAGEPKDLTDGGLETTTLQKGEATTGELEMNTNPTKDAPKTVDKESAAPPVIQQTATTIPMTDQQQAASTPTSDAVTAVTTVDKESAAPADIQQTSTTTTPVTDQQQATSTPPSDAVTAVTTVDKESPTPAVIQQTATTTTPVTDQQQAASTPASDAVTAVTTVDKESPTPADIQQTATTTTPVTDKQQAASTPALDAVTTVTTVDKESTAPAVIHQAASTPASDVVTAVTKVDKESPTSAVIQQTATTTTPVTDKQQAASTPASDAVTVVTTVDKESAAPAVIHQAASTKPNPVKPMRFRPIKCVDMNFCYFEIEFLRIRKRLLMITNLPTWPKYIYTKEDVIRLLAPLGFHQHFDFYANLVILPQQCLAFVMMTTPIKLYNLLMQVWEMPLHLNGFMLHFHVVSEHVHMTKDGFYHSLMDLRIPRGLNHKMHQTVVMAMLNERTVIVDNVSQIEAELLKAMRGVKNYLPLLDKERKFQLYIEFETVEDLDRVGLWFSRLYPHPSYDIRRLKIPQGITPKIVLTDPHSALPNNKDAVARTTTPTIGVSIPCGSVSPFWILMNDPPFFFPTASPTFRIPEHMTVTGLDDIEVAGGRGDLVPTMVMMTGLPEAGYSHEDVARLVWPYYSSQNVFSLYYHVMVLQHQRRAFVYFKEWLKCSDFVRAHIENPFTIQGSELSLHFLLQPIHPRLSESFMYQTLMEWNNTPVADPDSLEDRLLTVDVYTTNEYTVKEVIQLVTRAAHVVSYLPLGNRISFEIVHDDACDLTDVCNKVKIFPGYTKKQRNKLRHLIGQFERAKDLWMRLDKCCKMRLTLETDNEAVKIPNKLFPKLHFIGNQPAKSKLATSGLSATAGGKSGSSVATQGVKQPGSEVTMDTSNIPITDGGKAKEQEAEGSPTTSVSTIGLSSPPTVTSENTVATTSSPAPLSSPEPPVINQDMFKVLAAAVRQHRLTREAQAVSQEKESHSRSSRSSRSQRSEDTRHRESHRHSSRSSRYQKSEKTPHRQAHGFVGECFTEDDLSEMESFDLDHFVTVDEVGEDVGEASSSHLSKSSSPSHRRRSAQTTSSSKQSHKQKRTEESSSFTSKQSSKESSKVSAKNSSSSSKKVKDSSKTTSSSHSSSSSKPEKSKDSSEATTSTTTSPSSASLSKASTSSSLSTETPSSPAQKSSSTLSCRTRSSSAAIEMAKTAAAAAQALTDNATTAKLESQPDSQPMGEADLITEGVETKSDHKESAEATAVKTAESETEMETASEMHPSPQGEEVGVASQAQKDSSLPRSDVQSQSGPFSPLEPGSNEDLKKDLKKEEGKEDGIETHEGEEKESENYQILDSVDDEEGRDTDHDHPGDQDARSEAQLTEPQQSQTLDKKTFQILDSVDDEGKVCQEDYSQIEMDDSFQVLDSVVGDQTDIDPEDNQPPKDDKDAVKQLAVEDRSDSKPTVEDAAGKEEETSKEDPFQVLDSVSEPSSKDREDGKKKKEDKDKIASTEYSEDANKDDIENQDDQIHNTKVQTPDVAEDQADKDGDGKDAVQSPYSVIPEQETFQILDSVGDPEDESQELCPVSETQLVEKDNGQIEESDETYQVIDSLEDQPASTDQSETEMKERTTKKGERAARKEDKPTKRISTRSSKNEEKEKSPKKEAKTHNAPIRKNDLTTGASEKGEEVTEEYQIVDSVEDEPGQDALTTTAGSGRERSKRKRKDDKTTLTETSEKVLGEEEANYEILDSVGEETVNDNLTTAETSDRGKRERTVKREDKNEKIKTAQKEDTPTRKSRRVSEQANREKTPRKEDEATKIDSIPTKKSGVSKREVSEEEATYQILDSVEDETIADEPATTERSGGRGKRGRRKKVVKTTKKDSTSLRKSDTDASGEVVREEGATYQILDSVEDETVADLTTTETTEREKTERTKIKGKMDKSADEQTQKGGSLVAPSKSEEEEEEPMYQILDSVEDDKAQEGLTTTETTEREKTERTKKKDQTQNSDSLVGPSKSQEEECMYQILDSVEDDQPQEGLTTTEGSDGGRKEEMKTEDKTTKEEDTPTKTSTTTTGASEEMFAREDALYQVVDSVEDEQGTDDLATTEEESDRREKERTSKKEDTSTKRSQTNMAAPENENETTSKDKGMDGNATTTTSALVNLDEVSEEEEDYPDDTAEEEELRKRQAAAKETQLAKEKGKEKEERRSKERERRSSGGGSSRGRGDARRRIKERGRKEEEEKVGVDTEGLVTLDEVGADEPGEENEEGGASTSDGGITEGELQALVTLDEIVEEEEEDEKVEGSAAQSTPEPRPPSQENETGDSFHPETLTLDEAGGDEEVKTEEVKTEEAQPEETYKAAKRKRSKDDLEESMNFVTVDEVGEEEEEEVVTPRTRGKAKKRSRQAPVRKSTRGKQQSAKDEKEEEKEPPTTDVFPPTPLDAPSSLVKDPPAAVSDGQSELQKTEAEAAVSQPSLSASSTRQETQTQHPENKGLDGGVEAGEQKEGRTGAAVKAASKQRRDVVAAEAKRARSHSPTVPSDFKLPSSRSNNPIGVEFVVPKSGFFCNLCSVFYVNEGTAKNLHCSSQRHYENMEKHFQKRPKAASRNSTQGSTSD